MRQIGHFLIPSGVDGARRDCIEFPVAHVEAERRFWPDASAVQPFQLLPEIGGHRGDLRGFFVEIAQAIPQDRDQTFDARAVALKLRVERRDFAKGEAERLGEADDSRRLDMFAGEYLIAGGAAFLAALGIKQSAAV